MFVNSSTPSSSSKISDIALHKQEREEAVKIIQAVKGRWIAEPEKELKRLETEKPRIYHKIIELVDNHSDAYLCSLMHGLELMEALKKTHYCFFHGQSSEAYLLTRLITEWVEARDPSKAGKYRKFFRIPEHISDQPQNVTAFFKLYSLPEHSDRTTTPRDFSDCHHFNDHQRRMDLLSTSGTLLTKEAGEAAVHYYTNNTGNYFNNLYDGNKNFISKLKFFGNLLADEVGKLPRKEGLGFLQVIAIPKELVEKREVCGVYNAHALGYPTYAPIDDLKRLQNLETPQTGTTQYRILTSTLNNERVLTVTLTDKTDYKREFAYKRIKAIVQRDFNRPFREGCTIL